jgi:1,4-alpha-glucan branching enzyme
MGYYRRLPIGAELQKTGGTHFRVWATTFSNIGIRVSDEPGLTENAITADLKAEGNNYFSGYVPEAKAGQFYKLKLGCMLSLIRRRARNMPAPMAHPLSWILRAIGGMTRVGVEYTVLNALSGRD